MMQMILHAEFSIDVMHNVFTSKAATLALFIPALDKLSELFKLRWLQFRWATLNWLIV